MAGIVLRGGVILVETVRESLRNGLPVKEAIIQASIIRVRPIMITVITLIASALVVGNQPFWEGLVVSIVTSMVVYSFLIFISVAIGGDSLGKTIGSVDQRTTDGAIDPLASEKDILGAVQEHYTHK
jgi:hypothetical protein